VFLLQLVAAILLLINQVLCLQKFVASIRALIFREIASRASHLSVYAVSAKKGGWEKRCERSTLKSSVPSRRSTTSS